MTPGSHPLGDAVQLKNFQTITPVTLALLILLLSLSGCAKQRPEAANLYVAASQNSESLPLYGVFELTLKHNGVYGNKFFEPKVEVVFTAPHGEQTLIQGFYYGGDLWKVRFRPNEVGRWNYEYTMTGRNGFSQRNSGWFAATPSDARGPVIRNPNNRYQWTFANGSPYFPLGLQDCVTAHGSQLGGEMIDGGTRSEGGRKILMAEYFALYGSAGFNLYRFSQKNCSFPLFDDLDHYREAEAQATDELLSLAREHGFRVMFGFFGYYDSSPSRPVRAILRTLQLRTGLFAPNEKQKRFIDYCIARWGVYADYWELLNERKASDEWTTAMADYVHAHDPYRRPVSTSWEKPQLPAIDIDAPHWYESENELQSDLRVQEHATRWKQAGKPVIVGEQGNSGMNWDPTSGVRMRIRSWTALFEEITLVFWNTSWSKWGMHGGQYTPGDASNIYIGPEERGYVRVLTRFASQLEPGVRMATVHVSSTEVRAYGLRSQNRFAAYLVHANDHRTVANHIAIAVPASLSGARWVGEWIDPATGAELSSQQVPDTGTLEAPPFQIDLALLVRPL